MSSADPPVGPATVPAITSSEAATRDWVTGEVDDPTGHAAGLLDAAIGGGNPAGGARAASELYHRDADVVYAVAGECGNGVPDAATPLSHPATPLWVIGVDTDRQLSEPPSRRRHVRVPRPAATGARAARLAGHGTIAS